MGKQFYDFTLCSCDNPPPIDIKKGCGAELGLPYLMFWIECPQCKEVLQRWESREDAASAEHYFACKLMDFAKEQYEYPQDI